MPSPWSPAPSGIGIARSRLLGRFPYHLGRLHRCGRSGGRAVQGPLGPLPVVGAVAVCAAVLFVLRAAAPRPLRSAADTEQVSRRRALADGGPDGPMARPALLVGLLVTVAIGWLTVVLAIGDVDAISPTYDAVHHYSAVARVLSTGDGSSLTLGEITSPGRPDAYPAAWHDLVALVSLTSGLTVPAASNVMAFTAAAVVWPLCCTLLARQVAGPRTGILLVTPILATAFTAMPWLMMTWGVLWPNLLGLALAPAALAAVVGFTTSWEDGALSRPASLLLGSFATIGLALAHPNAVVSVLVLGLSPIAVAAIRSTVGSIRRRRYVQAVAAPVGAAANLLESSGSWHGHPSSPASVPLTGQRRWAPGTRCSESCGTGPTAARRCTSSQCWS
ncbi:DUF6541 family protein [Pseudonocardia sp. ICBG1034]|uniref:DUF6541 family protein n=1 Tax=Pseudonocardia sp. ICBG1034 TaxID=2844381 RepID=UPI0027E21273|nr:DUF6541 family protein [Pseudonocardia sp. ICBG1034]